MLIIQNEIVNNDFHPTSSYGYNITTDKERNYDINKYFLNVLTSFFIVILSFNEVMDLYICLYVGANSIQGSSKREDNDKIQEQKTLETEFHTKSFIL